MHNPGLQAIRLPLPGCLSQKCIAQCRLALRQAQSLPRTRYGGERKRQIPFVLSAARSPCRSTILLIESTYETASWGEGRGEGESSSIQPTPARLVELRMGFLEWYFTSIEESWAPCFAVTWELGTSSQVTTALPGSAGLQPAAAAAGDRPLAYPFL